MNTPIAHTDGSPIWMDLGTHDIDAATAFYHAIFGWKFSNTGDDFGQYRMIRSNNAAIGGAMSTLIGPEGPLTEPHSPTAWGIYLATTDIETTLSRAEQAGATIVFPAMPVGELGSMGLINDPTGATIGLWEPGNFNGIEATAAPNVPVWFELVTNEFDTALNFYSTALGWTPHWMTSATSNNNMPTYTPTPPKKPSIRYVINHTPAGPSAGMCEAPWLTTPMSSYWRMYVGVTDTDATITAITEQGGTLLDGPINSPFGRVATVTDPQGAAFQICSVPPKK
ncbi:VOC family protein [Dermatophilus congolensis]|uniref:VOC family protein n=1 Tax=Dermatophilus congolensis TaxID=1863 RepID=UPI001AAE22F2|nr:VOC family protein [Dermatophilus congolensis]MBO3142292.1 VOC family protein [Dermatophilus congolensis]MBO3151283.1 VOC family protein [Dermatophilus congolensis]MBO3161713.1 VOC family protein [Dermatophilus congolensis]MBO3162569.1 VOC family protein [Dermatophilus congolensis]MBO3176122.1 VOC family protein [Dermatophilus congolensis]